MHLGLTSNTNTEICSQVAHLRVRGFGVPLGESSLSNTPSQAVFQERLWLRQVPLPGLLGSSEPEVAELVTLGLLSVGTDSRWNWAYRGLTGAHTVPKQVPASTLMTGNVSSEICALC